MVEGWGEVVRGWALPRRGSGGKGVAFTHGKKTTKGVLGKGKHSLPPGGCSQHF